MQRATWIILLGIVGCSSSSSTPAETPDADAGLGEDAPNDSGSSGSDATIKSATLALGAQKSCRLNPDGTIQCWGRNQHGELGIGTTAEEKNRPSKVGTDFDWKSLSAGGFHICATKQSGALYCWGLSSSGQVGNGATSDCSSPLRVGEKSDWEMVTTGAYHTCGLRQNGQLWCWGWNSFGELGTGTSGQGTDELSPRAIAAPQPYRLLGSGDYHSCAIQTNGTLWCWGRNAEGQIGVKAGNTTSPVQVGTETDWIMVKGGQYHTCALRQDGSLWCWGANDKGQCAAGISATITSPTRVGTHTFLQLALGQSHTCALRSDFHLMCFGFNESGQLGNGQTTNEKAPIEVEPSSSWNSVAAGDWHTCGEKSDGKLYCWGWNYFGQLGTGTSSGPVSNPTAVQE